MHLKIKISTRRIRKKKEVAFSRAKTGIFSFNGTTLIEQPG